MIEVDTLLFQTLVRSGENGGEVFSRMCRFCKKSTRLPFSTFSIVSELQDADLGRQFGVESTGWCQVRNGYHTCENLILLYIEPLCVHLRFRQQLGSNFAMNAFYFFPSRMVRRHGWDSLTILGAIFIFLTQKGLRQNANGRWMG
jgi:hypothetical protein